MLVYIELRAQCQFYPVAQRESVQKINGLEKS